MKVILNNNKTPHHEQRIVSVERLHRITGKKKQPALPFQCNDIGIA